MTRHLVWFSAGAASAVAAKLTLAQREDVHIVYVNPGSEHPDNERFLRDCSLWFDAPIQIARSERYADTWQVWSERRYIVGPDGALCTAELKKRVRYSIQRPDDVQVFGYTAEEMKRAARFRAQNPEVELWCPLIDDGLTHADCLGMVERAGLELPAMYRLGYHNNNCIGCPKGGIGYWNKIRVDFPETFTRMAALERDIGASVLRADAGDGNKVRLWLDELDPERGDYPSEPDIECSLLCALAESKFA